VIAEILVAALLVFLQRRAGIDSWAVLIVASAVLAYVFLAAGRLLSRDPCSAYVIGLIGTCLAVYGLTALFPIGAATAFGAVALVVLGLRIALRRRLPGAPPERRALTAFALCVAFTAAWCFEPARAYEVVRTQGVLPLWSDYFFQGGVISQFGDARAVGRGSIYLADYPPSFYHFASYAPAAALAGVLDQPGLPLAAAAWLPLGFLAMLAGAHALGARLAGAAGGIAAVLALAVLPDASNYGLRNGWFSFHWTLMAHAGATYALGAAFVSLALLERSRRALIASALLAASTLLFRAHIFVLFMPAWIATAAMCSTVDPDRRRRVGWLMIGVLGIGAAATSLAVAHLGHWRLGEPALGDFLWYVHTGHEPTAYTKVYENLRTMDEPTFLLLAGVALAVAAALGAFVLALPAAAIVAREKGALRPIDAACGYLAFTWLLLMLFAPTPWHGDPSDLIHRPFVLLYAACAIWTFCLVLRILAMKTAWRAWPALAIAALASLPVIVATAGDMARPKFRWGAYDAAVRVPPGLVEAAAFMRKHAAPGDIFAVAGLTAGYATFDVSTQLCSLSGMPAYLSRPYFEMIKEAPRKQVAAVRLAALQELESLTEYAEAMRALRSLKVQWFVVAGDQGPRWDPQRRRAAFKAGTVALYALHDEMRVGNADQVVAQEALHLAELRAREALVGLAGAHVLAAVEPQEEPRQGGLAGGKAAVEGDHAPAGLERAARDAE
jgi:hypothetical protein